MSVVCLTWPLALANGGQRATELPDGVTAEDWAQLRSLVAAHQHEVQASGVGFEAVNPGLRATARFDGDSAIIESRDGAWSFGLELTSYGFDGHAIAVDAPWYGACAHDQELTYNWTDKVSEWWVNDSRGFEHGFQVWEQPEHGGGGAERGPLRFALDVLGTLTPEVNAARTGLVLRGEDGSVALRYDGLFAVDARGVELDAWLQVEGRALRINVDDSEAEYPLMIDPIVQAAYLKASTIGSDVRFGNSVAVSGDTVVVGAATESGAATGVNGDETDRTASAAGAAYVFVRTGSSWTQQAYLKASNTDAGDSFGISVAVSGDTVVVGACGEGSSATGVSGDETDNTESNAGAAYVFVRTGSSWAQQAYLKASNTDGFDLFGDSVGVFSDTVVVGASREASSATGVNGNGADNGTPFSGAAYVFARAGNSWTQQAYLKASNTGDSDRFGDSVAVSGDTVVVGAFGEASSAAGVNGDETDNAANRAGAAYVFVRAGSSWAQQDYLKASNTGMSDTFGLSVAVSGDSLVVGAQGESSSATGVNGDEADNAASAAGAAYVFVRTGSSWAQQAYLKASNTGALDVFGNSVAVSGDTVVVGATGEDSGFIGDEADNTATRSGAAYVFSGLTFPGIGDLVCVGTSNSTGLSGNLTATGSRATLDNSLTLEISRCPASTFGLIASSSSNGGPISDMTIGAGTLCIANGQLGRFPILMTDASGAATQAVNLNAIPTNLGLAAALPGDTYYFQFWHRDTVGGMATSNLTSAVSVLFE